MCLQRPLSDENIPLKGEGYKAFIVDRKGLLYGDNYSEHLSRDEGVWLDEKDFRDCDKDVDSISYGDYVEEEGYYTKGWHIWLSYDDAVKWAEGIPTDENQAVAVCKVAYRRRVAYGVQHGIYVSGPCVITKDMKILQRILE